MHRGHDRVHDRMWMTTSENDLGFIDDRLSNVPTTSKRPSQPRSTQDHQTEFGCNSPGIINRKWRKRMHLSGTKNSTKALGTYKWNLRRKHKQEKRKDRIPKNWRFYCQKNDKTLEEGIRLPTMEDLYFQKNEKTLKDVPRQHCQATALWTLKKVISSKTGLQHLEQLQE